MLCDAIEYGDQHSRWWEWFDTDAVKEYPWEQQGTQRWLSLDARARARWFTTQLWNCGDVVPAKYLAFLNYGPGLTYAQVVARLRHDIADLAGAPVATGRR
jgi:anaerobic glycerol-3-phosphate dehydrogenase